MAAGESNIIMKENQHQIMKMKINGEIIEITESKKAKNQWRENRNNRRMA
jgi:hypothetical protein